MKRVLASLAVSVSLCVMIVNDVFGGELYSTSLFTDANLQGYWRMEDNWNDSGPNHYNLTPVNSPTFVDAKYGKGGHFVATSSQYATIASASCPALEISGAQTWVAWHKNSSYANYETIMAKANVGQGYLHGLAIDGYDNLVSFNLDGLGTHPEVHYAMPTDGLFHHYAGRWNPEGMNLSLWIDGIKVAENYATGSATNTGGDFSIGRRGSWAQYQNGDTDDAAIFSRALTDVEIANLVNQPPTAFSLTAPSNPTSTNNNKPTFSWGTSTDPESQTITYTLKLSTTVGFTEPVYRTVSELSATSYTPAGGQEITDNSYYWKVIASDGEMTTESTQTWQVTVDTQVPVVPIITFIGSNSQTGKISEIRGTGESGTTLTFYDKNGGTISGTTVWDGGNFTFTPTTPLDSGSVVYVRSIDAATNVSQSNTKAIIFETYDNIFKDDTTFHGDPPGNSMRMEKDTSYYFNIAVNDGVAPDPDKPVTIKAYVQYNTEYGSAGKPKITLSGLGISGTETGQYAVATDEAPNNWEQLTVTGTPNARGVVTLKVETFSTADGAKAWIDDISVAQ